MTAIVEAARGFISGEPEKSALAAAAAVGIAALMLAYATSSLRRAERGE